MDHALLEHLDSMVLCASICAGSPGKAHCDRRCVRERGAEFVPLSMKYRPVEHHRIHCTGKSEEATKTANKTVDEKVSTYKALLSLVFTSQPFLIVCFWTIG